MKLIDVFNLFQSTLLEAEHQIKVKGLTSDSREVRQGYLFIAISGFENDGHDYTQEAIANGAIAIIGEKPLALKVPYIQVADARQALGKISSEFYSHPSLKARIIGITGTNGKTTTAYLIHHLITEAGFTCGMIGTVENKINNQSRKAINTTPDALALQVLLNESNDEFIVIEISSHALHQHRTEGLQLDLAMFTNLTHDHMDYHQTIDAYYEQKKRIFSLLKKDGIGLVNIDDKWGKKLSLENLQAKIKTIGEEGNYELQLTSEKGSYRFRLINEEGEMVIAESPLPGQHNLFNTAFATAACLELGIPKEAILNGITTFSGVPGRWETFRNNKGANFIIDYAHTEDALQYLLQTAEESGARKIFMIFGFRGKRDKSKREKMVKVAATYCHGFILTSDDLNGESRKEVERELHDFTQLFPNGDVIMDRTQAITEMWNRAEAGDWVFITGKGREAYHENYCLETENDCDTVQYLLSNDDAKR